VNFKLYIVENLHAKIYYDKSEALITSMNLYLHSATHNYELGVVIQTHEVDEKNKLEKYIQYLLEVGELYLSDDEINQKEEIKEITVVDDSQPIEFRVFDKTSSYYHVETPEGYDRKIALDQTSMLELNKSYKATAKIIYKEFRYGYNIYFSQFQDLKELDHFCLACKAPTDEKELLCSKCREFKTKSKIPINPHYCHKCGYNWGKIDFGRPYCTYCYHRYG